ncbi:hypothetical protein BH09VER1_BH09VER1_36590 [soil metagenome]
MSVRKFKKLGLAFGFLILAILFGWWLMPRGGDRIFDHHPLDGQKSLNDAQEMAKALATPINFYGIVLDQDNKPVDGAKVTYSIVQKLEFSNPPPQTGPSAGRDGRFSIVGQHGASMYVKVERTGYEPMDSYQQSFNFYQSSSDATPSRLPTATDPAVFQLYKPGNAEPLIHAKPNSLEIPFDGTPVQIGLRKSATEIVSKGDIQLQCWSEQKNDASKSRHFPWKCLISVPNGELVEQSNSFVFCAPESGYVESDLIDLTNTGDAEWDMMAERKYFLHYTDGTYARARVRVIAGRTKFAVIESFYNPSGSRNLEFHPDKEIDTH